MAYLGNTPGVSSQRLVSEFTATGGQTIFTPSGGYSLGYVDVLVNGVELKAGDDFTAADGITVVLTSPAVAGDEVKIKAWLPRGLSDGYTKAESDARYEPLDSAYTKAESDAKYPTKANNLSDLASASTARTNLGLGTLATVSPTGTANTTTFLRGDNSWQVVAVTPTAVSDQENLSTGYFDLPSGTTAQRPASPTNGMIRYNTTLGQHEIYQGGVWNQFTFSYQVEYLIVAGGGGGGGRVGGGGGGGGYIASSIIVNPNNSYSITVGGGGTGGFGGLDGTENIGTQGANSSAFSATAIGGGWGRDGNTGSGGDGGSGGGSGYGGTPGNGTSGQGNRGGFSSGGSGNYPYKQGGGGGAGAVGGDGTSSDGKAGNGGNGLTWLNGSTYAGGGGGGSHNPFNSSLPNNGRGLGGTGGGGNAGAPGGKNAGDNGTANTGGGGGGGSTDSSFSYKGGNGGSGIVILRYAGSQRGTGGTVTSSGGYTYHTFTSSGTFTS